MCSFVTFSSNRKFCVVYFFFKVVWSGSNNFLMKKWIEFCEMSMRLLLKTSFWSVRSFNILLITSFPELPCISYKWNEKEFNLLVIISTRPGSTDRRIKCVNEVLKCTAFKKDWSPSVEDGMWRESTGPCPVAQTVICRLWHRLLISTILCLCSDPAQLLSTLCRQ